MLERTCIYCLKEKSLDQFNIEHVIPESFGSFSNNLTLDKLVCSECNSFFGNNLDIVISRDTPPGLMRYTSNIPVFQKKKYKHLGKKSKVNFQIAEGKFKGAYFYLDYNNRANDIVPYLFSQVGFKSKDSNEFAFFLKEKIPSLKELILRGIDLNGKLDIVILGHDYEGIVKELEDLHIPFYKRKAVDKDDFPKDTFMADVTRQIDDIVLRAYAKIAFNYYAYNKNDSNHLREEQFDELRKFIRYGISPTRLNIVRKNQCILNDERANLYRLGHILTLEKSKIETPLIKVSLMNNHYYYKISISKKVVKEDFKPHGHFYNFGNMSILELCSKSKK